MWFFLLSGLIACAGKAVSSSCAIEMTPPRAAVRIQDSFSANCSSSSEQTDSMGWESSNGGVALTSDVHFLPLNINSVTDWHLEPQCYINFPNGSQCLEILPVIVYKMPDSVSLSQPSQLGPMIEGEQYRMQCDVVNVAPVKILSVHWHKGNKIFHNVIFDDSSVTPVNQSSVVNLIAHRDDNGTQIWCEAKLNFWPTGPNIPSIQSKSHEATVLYPPTFTQPENETLELLAGSKITLNCTAAGNPTPVYSWHFPHDIQRTDKNQNTNQPILTPSFELTGTYKCTVSNTQGTKTKYFTVIEAKSSMQVTGCLPDNNTDCDIGAVRSPLNVSSTISITLNRTHNGAEFRCEAQLDFGPEGPQPPPNMMSSPLNISVYYKPIINTTKLPKTIPVFRGYPEELVCEADGHPPPKIQWLFSPDKVPHLSGDTLTVSEAGIYNCSATNEVDSISYEVEVILKEDYLPLIAGFVAVTVVAISIVFIFIYSIYYKNTKMRCYSLKNPKPSTHNGNVAHNGWDM